MNDAIKMQISAFVDGELPSNEAEMLVRRMSQDAELRQQVADYLETGRLIRGERSVSGMDRLRARIGAEIDERPLQEEIVLADQKSTRYVRPLAGVAIAATVALAAIFGLQQNAFMADQGKVEADASVAAGTAVEEIYTVPAASDAMLHELRQRHGGSSLGLDDVGIDSRLVSQVREGQLTEVDVVDKTVVDEEDEDESAAETPDSEAL